MAIAPSTRDGSAPAAPGDVAERFTVPGSWAFTPAVAEVFDEHVTASVPFYEAIQSLVAQAADWLAPSGAVIADLGAATGTTAARIARRHPERAVTFHLYDAAPEMLTQAEAKLAGTAAQVLTHPSRLEAGLVHSHASLTLALFTLQFLDPVDRLAVLAHARHASRDEGAILLAEKLRLDDGRWQEIAAAVTGDHKAEHGIAEGAIRAKERALRGVLVPATDAANRRLLAGAGWASIELLFRWHCWAVYGAFAT